MRHELNICIANFVHEKTLNCVVSPCNSISPIYYAYVYVHKKMQPHSVYTHESQIIHMSLDLYMRNLK